MLVGGRLLVHKCNVPCRFSHVGIRKVSYCSQWNKIYVLWLAALEGGEWEQKYDENVVKKTWRGGARTWKNVRFTSYARCSADAVEPIGLLEICRFQQSTAFRLWKTILQTPVRNAVKSWVAILGAPYDLREDDLDRIPMRIPKTFWSPNGRTEGHAPRNCLNKARHAPASAPIK